MELNYSREVPPDGIIIWPVFFSENFEFAQVFKQAYGETILCHAI